MNATGFGFAGCKGLSSVWVKLASVVGTLIACWPSVGWYVARLGDGSDEPWGALALLAAACFGGVSFRQALSQWRLIYASGASLALLLAGSVMTPLIQGIFVMLALGSLVADRRCWVGHIGLFLLALPVISSLQFYGGFPLRWLIGQLSSGLLNLAGCTVEARGVVMLWRGEAIVIDAPCSGVQMLWSSGFLACLMICIHKLDVRRSLMLLQVASVSAYLGNVLRNCLLFFLESGLLRLGSWAHGAIGVFVFALVVACVVWAGGRLAVREATLGEIWRDGASTRCPGFVAYTLILVGVCFAGNGAADRLPEGSVHRNEIITTKREKLLAEGWVPLSLDDRSAEYARGFPGTIELLTKGDRRLVVRVIDRATRRYHLSADCYRALGYAIEPMPLLKKVDGTLWGRSLAKRGRLEVELRERVVSLDGQSWTDPSSWFWSALLGKSEGPWVGYSESVPPRDG